jgi:hypothetical protein
MYRTLLALPASLSPAHLLPLQPYATYLLSVLLSSRAFHILPKSSLRPQNPTELPRGRFVEDTTDTASESSTAKKKGRPSKRDKARKAKDAVAALDRWLEKNTYTFPDSATEDGGGPGVVATATVKTTHTLISHPPTGSRAIYSMEKTRLLNIIDRSGTSPRPDNAAGRSNVDGSQPPMLPVNLIDPAKKQAITDAHGPLEREALARANDAVLARLKRIDEMAAERGLEVGGEGGEKTGLSRVERAVQEFKEGGRGGIMSLLEGAGLEGAVSDKGGTDSVEYHNQ